MTDLSQGEKDKLEGIFERGSSVYEVWPEHWVSGEDSKGVNYPQEISFCYECAEGEIEKLRKKDPGGSWVVDGGWGSESDDFPFCSVQGCWKPLRIEPTAHCCEESVRHFLMYGFDHSSAEDCYQMREVLSDYGWGENYDMSWSGLGFGSYKEAILFLGKNILNNLEGKSCQHPNMTPGTRFHDTIVWNCPGCRRVEYRTIKENQSGGV